MLLRELQRYSVPIAVALAGDSPIFGSIAHLTRQWLFWFTKATLY
jgi:hypothetical protein